MRWPEDLDDWPGAATSRQIRCGPHLWHVQDSGSGPALLLIHGAGSATMTWRGVTPHLTSTHRTIAIDLPGQGLTRTSNRARCGLSPMAEDIAALIAQEDWQPAALAGHSAGAAIALRLAADRPCPVLALNPALTNFEGTAGWLFPMLAKLLSLNPLSAPLFAAGATPAKVRRLIEGTGSHLDRAGLTLYHRLASDRAHVDGTLSMMARWSLDDLLARLGTLAAPVRVLLGDNDRAVPPDRTEQACAALPDCRIDRWPDLGHLIHEEAGEKVAAWMRAGLEETL